MPDDTVKNVNLAIPSTPIQEHPQNVTVIPRRRKRRGDEETGEEAEHGSGGSGPPTGPIEDKVTISSSMSGEEEKDRDQRENGEAKQPRQENGAGTKHIDIKV